MSIHWLYKKGMFISWLNVFTLVVTVLDFQEQNAIRALLFGVKVEAAQALTTKSRSVELMVRFVKVVAKVRSLIFADLRQSYGTN